MIRMSSLLEDDHEDLGGILRDLFTSLDEGDVEESFKRLDLFWARLGVHIRAENLCLFPAILQGLNDDPREYDDNTPTFEEARCAINKLRADHNFFMRELSGAVNQLRDLRVKTERQAATNILQALRDRVADVGRRLEEHNKFEEGQVYKWTNKLLDVRGQTLLTENLRRELENLPPRHAVTNIAK